MTPRLDDLNDDLNDLWNDAASAARAPAPLPPKAASLQIANGGDVEHTENCHKCGGSGRYRHLGPCFACKGKGTLTFKTSSAERLRARAGREARRVRSVETTRQAFAADHPDVWAWMDGNTFGFAVTLMDALDKWGSLTTGQLQAARRMIERRDAAKAASAEARAPMPMAGIEKAFEAARASGLKAPRLRLPTLELSCAKASSSNPGAVYVKRQGLYLGKIIGGTFHPARECTAVDKEALQAAAADPVAAAVEYGRATGSCSCCGRELTDPQSVARGIGPVCADNFGW